MVVINNTVLFERNTGFRGGAVSMYGNSKFHLKENSSLVFLGNECLETGGAMYVVAPGKSFASAMVGNMHDHRCFFVYEKSGVSYENWKTTVKFQDNHAPTVYATTLMNCDSLEDRKRKHIYNQILEWPFVEFCKKNGSAGDAKREISTDPINITCDRKDWKVSPGQVSILKYY